MPQRRQRKTILGQANTLLENMNPEQREAIMHVDGPLIIFAGPGSGKTRVIVNRTANLIMNHGVSPSAILVVTFTNKAANEVRERVAKLTSGSPRISTFHSLGLWIMRKHGSRTVRPGFTRKFTIHDEVAQKSVIRSILRDIAKKEAVPVNTNEKDLVEAISLAKNSGKLPRDIESRFVKQVYDAYERDLLASNALDFDDLILEPVRLLRTDSRVRAFYNEQIKYMMVDEYQDTNRAQYELTRLLTETRKNVVVVGDDDQAIYGWRGADINNVRDFERHFPTTRKILLEQNYRSTKNILDAAGGVIQNNQNRVGKVLRTEAEPRELVGIHPAWDEHAEALFIAEQVKTLTATDPKNRCAVLYRKHFQAAHIEAALRMHGMKYAVRGGSGFYDKKEIMDIVAYLKLALCPTDSYSIGRIYNEPPRGIGDETMSKIRGTAKDRGTNVWDVINEVVNSGELRKRTEAALVEFIGLLNSLRNLAEVSTPTEMLASVLTKTKYGDRIQDLDDKNSDGRNNRQDNVQELMEVFKAAENRGEYLEKILDTACLTANADGSPAEEPNAPVILMTLHASKGLEFPVVFIAGCEEGLCPDCRCATEEEIEEERRLFFVGMTRAQRRLILTYAYRRQPPGMPEYYPEPSRFLGEIPEHLLERFRVPAAVA
jgi:DNA helicase-2/ATP-dependent DNA helicase PcrA